MTFTYLSNQKKILTICPLPKCDGSKKKKKKKSVAVIKKENLYYCSLHLFPQISESEENPGRVFYSCINCATVKDNYDTYSTYDEYDTSSSSSTNTNNYNYNNLNNNNNTNNNDKSFFWQDEINRDTLTKSNGNNDFVKAGAIERQQRDHD